jgi:hypothetical protein
VLLGSPDALSAEAAGRLAEALDTSVLSLHLESARLITAERDVRVDVVSAAHERLVPALRLATKAFDPAVIVMAHARRRWRSPRAVRVAQATGRPVVAVGR